MLRAASVGACIALLVACGPGGGGLEEGVVARIGDRDLAYEDFESFLDEGVGEGGTGLDNRVLAALFEQFLDEELLRQLAVDRDLVHAAASRRRAVEALLGGERSVVGDREVAAYYAEHQREFQLEERVFLRQLLVEDREQAEVIHAQLEEGIDFLEIVRGQGERMASAVVDQGEFTRDDLPEEFRDPVFGLQAGEVSEILEADYGFHIFQVVERSPAAIVPLETASESIRRRLETEQGDAAIRAMLEEARQRYNVEVAADSLPFTYPRGESLE